MHTMSGQEVAANFMATAAHLLVGTADRHTELNDRVAIMFGGEPPNFPTLRHWGDWVRRCGRPIVHFSFEDGQYIVPTVALVCVTDGQTRMFEHCHLWQHRHGGGAILIPDNFKWGAYAIDAGLNLAHRSRPPVLSERTALAGMRRAYGRFAQISHEQVERGLRFELPTRLEERAA